MRPKNDTPADPAGRQDTGMAEAIDLVKEVYGASELLGILATAGMLYIMLPILRD